MERKTRDIDQDYINDLVAQHESYSAVGRTKEAEKVAEVLLERYDHDVDAKPADAPEPEAEKVPDPDKAPQERADTKAPDTAVQPKAQRRN